MIFIVSYRENVRNFTQGSSGFLSIYEIKIRSLTTLEFKSTGKWRNGYYINNRKITVLSKLLGNQISRTMLRN